MKTKNTASLETFIDGLDASVDGRGYGVEHENARHLLEAAPDMLAALKTAWNNLDAKSLGRARWTGSDQRAFEAITAAIAKAEGRA